MRKEKPPPVNAKLIDPYGNLNHQWFRWFQTIGQFFDDYRHSPDLTFTANASLTTDDFGKMIVFNTASGDLTCSLPAITSKDINCWIGPIFRLGTNRLLITVDRLNYIEYSTIGGSISCAEPKRYAANVTLGPIDLTHWAIIAGTGIWEID